MARVPGMERLQDIGGVRLTAAPTAETYGAGVADQVSRAGLLLYAEAARDADQSAFLEADRKASELQTQLQLRVTDLKGKDSRGALDVAKEEWDKGIIEIRKGLTNQRQIQAFDRSSTGRWEALNKTTQVHVRTERATIEAAESKAYIENETALARLNASDPDAAEQSIRRQRAVIAHDAASNGVTLNGPIHLAEERKIISNTRREVLAAMVDAGRDADAASYYQQHKTDFTPADADRIEKVVNEGSTRRAGLALAEQAFHGVRDTEGERSVPDEEGAQLAYIREHEDNPKIRDAAISEVKTRWEERRRLDRQTRDTAFQQAINAIKPGSGVNPEQVVPPSTYATFSLPERTALAALADPGGDRPNDNAKWLQFLAMNPEQVSRLPLTDFVTKYWVKFDNATRKRAETQYNTAIDKAYSEGKKEAPTTATLTFKEQFQNEMRLSGMFTADKEPSQFGVDEAQRYSRLQERTAAAVETYERVHKRKATVTEIGDIIRAERDTAIQEVFVPGSDWFGGAKRMQIADLSEDQRGRAIVPLDKIPDDERQRLMKYLQSRNIAPTPSKVERAYAQAMLGNRKAFEQILMEKPGADRPRTTIPAGKPENLP